MPYIPLPIPPGLFRNGTRYQAKNQWFESNLVRWFEGAMGSVGGWRRLGEGFGTVTNHMPWSANIQAGGTSSGVDDPTSATSLFGSPYVALAIPDPGDAAPNHWIKTAATVPSGSAETVTLILERVGEHAETDFRVQDDPATEGVVTVTLDWDALTVATSGDYTVTATELVNMGEGPNGGQLVRVSVSYDALAAPNAPRVVRLAPTGFSNTEAGSVIWHHAQIETESSMGPIVLTSATSVERQRGRIELSSPPFGMFAWKDNASLSRLALGTVDRAYAYADGVVTDITPDGFVAGSNFAQLTTGRYGAGAYGAGVYSEGDTSLTELAEAQSWQFDNFGQFLVAHAHSDGKLYSWDLDDLNDLEPLPNAPENNAGVVVTPERFVVALGADGDPRKLQWPDQESLSEWTPTLTNQAGDWVLPGAGGLVAGRRGRNETLLWTTDDLFAMRYVSGTIIYTFTEVGRACGPISRRAMATADGGRAFWMGHKSFFLYNGYTSPIPSSVSDDVFNNLNRQQASKIHAVPLAEYGEVWWFYPSLNSVENDRYVVFNYREGTWAMGRLQRNAGVDRGVFSHPLIVDRLGVVYEHEKGTDKPSLIGIPLVAYAETGPIEIGNGDQVMRVRQLIPDETILGTVSATLYASRYPTTAESSYGPFTLANPTSVRLTGRSVRLRLDEVQPGWRVGTFRIEAIPGGRR